MLFSCVHLSRIVDRRAVRCRLLGANAKTLAISGWAPAVLRAALDASQQPPV
jgi:hypothetical protein